MTIDEQCAQVRKVKRAENGMIDDPVTIKGESTVGDALKIMADNHIGGLPVVDSKKRLVGIITNRDVRFLDNMSTPVSEVMTKDNLVTAPKNTDYKKATDILKHFKVEKLPVVDADGTLLGLITYKDITKIKNNPNATKDEKGRLRVAAAVGIKSDSIEKVERLIEAQVDAVVLDTAHGHSEGVLQMIKKVRQTFPDIQMVAGNIATGAAALALKDCGVDAVKVGIGPGSICTTRIIAGIGVPQLTAIMKVGDISEPFESADNEGRNGNTIYKIIRLDRIIPAHTANIENDYSSLLQLATQKADQTALDKFITEKQKTAYIVIDPLFQKCNFKKQGWIK